ncbi:spore coat protein [Clostridium sp. SHJSY1]|uniref:spore coat protein n=1 Tax=Clostridium sp. SHJSY1 TaxID=2942483 RepID=UPI00287BC122|nr:spore coat protein [Clostridium sp. SHJSY1]
MIIINNLTLNEYLIEKNISVIGEYFKEEKSTDDIKILSQVLLINKVDIILSNYYGNGTTRINSTVGKKIESIKVEIKKLRRDLRIREKKDNLNVMDKFILENGESILKRGEETINLINEIDYLNIIRRSMKENEICLGRVGEDNLREGETIEIGSLKNISYNLKEEDIYEYLRRVRRRKIQFKEDYYIDEFIKGANLKKYSKDYIKILLQIPYDTLRQWYRYSQGKRRIMPDKYLENIKFTSRYEIKKMKGGN